MWESQPNPGLDGNTVSIQTGSTLGGTSAINGAHWTRPAASGPASWGIAGLDEAAADRLYEKAAAQVSLAVPPASLQQTYVEDWIDAATAAGITVVPDECVDLPECDAAGVPVPEGTVASDTAFKVRVTADVGGRRIDSHRGYVEPVLAPGGVCASNLIVVQVRRHAWLGRCVRVQGCRHGCFSVCQYNEGRS